MNSILMAGEPLIRKCCFVIPLRLCLQTWAFLKVILDLLAVGYIALLILGLLAFQPRGPFTAHILLALLDIALLVDVGFLIALVVGVLKKSVAILQVFFIYELYVMVTAVAFLIYICVTMIKTDDGRIVVITFGAIYILLDLWMIIILKSEIVKLRNKNQSTNIFSVMSPEDESTRKFKAEDL